MLEAVPNTPPPFFAPTPTNAIRARQPRSLERSCARARPHTPPRCGIPRRTIRLARPGGRDPRTAAWWGSDRHPRSGAVTDQPSLPALAHPKVHEIIERTPCRVFLADQLGAGRGQGGAVRPQARARVPRDRLVAPLEPEPSAAARASPLPRPSPCCILTSMRGTSRHSVVGAGGKQPGALSGLGPRRLRERRLAGLQRAPGHAVPRPRPVG
jgi:hypothetical protein